MPLFLISFLFTFLFFPLAPMYSGTRELAILVSPACLTPGAAFRVIIASDKEISEKSIKICFKAPEAKTENLVLKKRGGGPPFWQWWQGKVAIPGQYQLEVYLNGKIAYSQTLTVTSSLPEFKKTEVFWKAEKSWTRAEENLYSAWIEALFHEADENDSWPDLSSVLCDPEKNFLHNHLCLSEDNGALHLEPDCADNPFFLRAYFAWKIRLPFGFHECSRGSLEHSPGCGRWLTNEMPAGTGDEIKKFAKLMRLVMNTVHSGTARTELAAQVSDYYPLPLTRDDLRPGVVYADPYGHTLILVRWVPQRQDKPGELLAVDAQPDGTVGIKRFWKGNFLFATENVVGQPGFKAFRPIINSAGRLRLMTNQEIQESQDYGNFSLEQLKLQPEKFYDRMESLINPEPLDPEIALKELYRALHEQLLVRVESVEIGEKFMQAHPGYVIPMPSGSNVFLSTGPWEDYSTPNRDLRLLIAMDTIEEFPEKVLKHPERFRIKKSETPEKIKSKLEDLSSRLAEELSITYTRSDGSSWTLTLKEIFRRKEALEMAYNPNDCVEIRWGAPEGSEECSTCRRRAPADQRMKMEKLRLWFRKRLHPPT